MVAQVYQCIALEASRAQHSRDNSEMARRGLDILKRESKRQDADGTASSNGSDSDSTHSAAQRGGGGGRVQRANSHDVMMEIHQPLVAIDLLFQWWELAKVFLRENEFGRGLSVLLPFAGLISIGAIVIGPIEGWSVVESLYFAVVSLTTVGFGDYYPTQPASTWFCILWLPFSIGFMSLFLANVAAFYIRLSDKNIERIERQLRRRIQRAKEQAEKERDTVFRRAMRGQQYSASTIEMGSLETATNRTDEKGTGKGADARPGSPVKRRRGFDTIPMEDEPEVAASTHKRSARHLFGSLEPPVAGLCDSRRQRILKNSIELPEPSNESGELRPQGSSMSNMKDILRTVHNNLNAAGGSTAMFRASGPENEFLSIRSTKSVSHHSLRSDPIRKPSFALRVLVQERFSEIFATDIAGYQSSIEIKENTLSVTIDTLKGTADKWLIPRRARKAFRAVAFEALYFVGEHGLITRGADALYDLSPFEFHGLFTPLLAALGDAETMEGWLASTNILADVDLRRDPSRSSLAHFAGGDSDQRRVSKAERLQTVMDRSVQQTDHSRGMPVTVGNAFANR
jgi:voltage-gated potassium channel